MGYACPVCSTPQADGEHLANHLAFTAMLHGGDHEAWLDANVPEWAERDPDGLAEAVTPLAEETDHEVESEGVADAEHAHAGPPQWTRPGGAVSWDPETRRIVERALEMTRRMQPESENSDEET